MNGILIVDKPTDWTSHDVVAKLRGALKTRRIGHGGTLDPMATGVLPIFVGRATRAAEFCENADKEYIAGLRLGVVTDTQDITGTVLNQVVSEKTSEDVRAILPHFTGPQNQIPPMYSAIKKDGKKLYELARKGIEIERPARFITIFELELLDGINNTGSTHNLTNLEPTDFTLRVVSSKGTYVRTLCHDIGAALGTGGTMSALRRTRAGSFTIKQAHSLDEILTAASNGEISKLLLPTDSFFSDFPALTLTDSETSKVKNGASFPISKPCGRYRFYGPSGEFLALAEVVDRKSKLIKSFFEPMENSI
ncbi:MAG: tRNA pseudouridine(55) synthase TruB [Oscillospiraceae bacterium]|nr:tRNA pseudouridine(55) synthase TruB [Oscillospiraceae bacterium]